MPIKLFKRWYVVRHYSAQKIVNGYAVANFEDDMQLLDVQPSPPNQMSSEDAGQRTNQRLTAYGHKKLQSTDQFSGTFGDHLFYNGLWYECMSCVWWNHTMLWHYQSQFDLCEKQDEPPKEVMPGDPEGNEETDLHDSQHVLYRRNRYLGRSRRR